ncbi:hypothetical protein CCR95_00030 [Thiocystis minor]|uniref:hypothetical protein n=1 Tax=Thiocystis minor TaxID=61597 RepID=UPI001913377A|nr:hypothetical protein [Thiocystis minor]MBK5962540.1 hypothetical protein [Thiocystis minor]
MNQYLVSKDMIVRVNVTVTAASEDEALAFAKQHSRQLDWEHEADSWFIEFNHPCWLVEKRDIPAPSFDPTELLENVLVKARESLVPIHPGSDEGIYADWLENLIINQPDALDALASATPKNAPGPIVWIEADKRRFSLMPSDALFRLVLLARAAGLSTPETEEAQAFCARYGNKLDALLTTVQVG